MEKKKNEIVSVVIPCYNQGIYLRECLDSVYSQTYSFIEVILINDGSTDVETIKILNELPNEYENIKIYNIQNVGVAKARNYGIEHAKGIYILPLDGDDKIHSTFIEKCVSIIQRSDIDIVYSITKLFGEKNYLFPLESFDSKKMLYRNSVVCTALFRKKSWLEVNGYNENMRYGYEDWDFWLSMIEHNKKFYRINEVLFYYRIKSSSRNANINNDEAKIKNAIIQLIHNHPQLYGDLTYNQISQENRRINKLYSLYQLIKLYYFITLNRLKKRN